MLVSCFASCCNKCKTDKKEAPKTETIKKEVPKKMAENIFQTTQSGLKYKVLKDAEKNAATPTAGKNVTVHYTGWLAKDDTNEPDLNKKFDSSVDRGQKFIFQIGVGRVIRGWDEGVLAMKVGEKRRLVIPSELGYGARGAGGVIPPNATLIFDVELFEIT